MTFIGKIVSVTLLTMVAASGTFAADFTSGTVKKLDAKAMKVTITHEELKTLGMPAMTMVFRVKDDALLDKLKDGAKIAFVAERVEGKLTVTDVK